jgi:acetyltransferase-like isoleucine patch superfamily enzyme
MKDSRKSFASGLTGLMLGTCALLYTAVMKRGFYRFGEGSSIHPLFNTSNRRFISIGNHVTIGSFSWIGVVGEPTGSEPRLIIEDGCSLGPNSFIMAYSHVHLHRDVLLGPRVYIADHFHGYENPNLPVIDQPVCDGGPTVVEGGCFLGIGSCILNNVTVGRHSVVGANAVVTKDVPPYSLVVGNPGRVVKRYDPERRAWIKVKSQ